MGKYGSAAEIAARISVSSHVNPRAAWDRAVAEIFPDSPTSREKGCPRNAFLALCEMGIVKGIAPGEYTRSVRNKEYAKRAISELRSNPSLVDDDHELWQRVTRGNDIVPNHQMDVVTTLWLRGFLAGMGRL